MLTEQHSTTDMTGSLVTIARITRPQGLRGHVRIRIDFDDPDLLEPGREVLLVQGTRSEAATIESCRLQHGRWVAKFEGIDSVDDTGAWIGASVCVGKEALSETGEGEYFSFDLEGCTVFAHGQAIGVVEEVLPSGGGAMLRLDRSGSEVLVPFVNEYLKRVDVALKRIDVELPAGLVDLNG